ncbi:hypothetical protein Acr_19g0004630 [Actinidia rufa]|uniref:Uncharacterized protein n=1 Tax=Actinidia rufa TaxID=165716 RepID=A0A7J0G9N8_9ERIC|nr:hypothetical protein Acr_19g0004630 [Actinidia rufa]
MQPATSPPPTLLITLSPALPLSEANSAFHYAANLAISTVGKGVDLVLISEPSDRGKTSPWNLAKSSTLSSPEPPSDAHTRQELGYRSSSPLGEVNTCLINSPESIYTGNYPLRDLLIRPTVAGYPQMAIPQLCLLHQIGICLLHPIPPSEDLAVIHGHGPLLRL